MKNLVDSSKTIIKRRRRVVSRRYVKHYVDVVQKFQQQVKRFKPNLDQAFAETQNSKAPMNCVWANLSSITGEV